MTGLPEAEEILDNLMRILNLAIAIEREPLDIGHGVLLHASEIHLIEMAGRYPDESLSRIASRLGITKGAVSQTAQRLEEKGYLLRINPEGDRKTIVFRLTKRGQEALEWHRTYHEKVNTALAKAVSGITPDEFDRLKSILRAVEEILERSPDIREQHARQFRNRVSHI